MRAWEETLRVGGASSGKLKIKTGVHVCVRACVRGAGGGGGGLHTHNTQEDYIYHTYCIDWNIGGKSIWQFSTIYMSKKISTFDYQTAKLNSPPIFLAIHVHTIFTWSDAAATIYFITRFYVAYIRERRLIESSVYSYQWTWASSPDHSHVFNVPGTRSLSWRRGEWRRITENKLVLDDY